LELTTVTDTAAVLHDGVRAVRVDGLAPDEEATAEGLTFRTLPRPPGDRLATVATVNDLHLGEEECGRYDGLDLGPVLRVEPGEAPYPETMARAAAAEVAAGRPDAVVAKGDVTGRGRAEELAAFLDIFQPAFGERLHLVKGNHDVASGGDLPAWPAMTEVALPGVRLALLDTSIPGQASGRVTDEAVEWLDAVAGDGDGRPVLVFGHHPLYDPGSPVGGVDPDGSDRMVQLFSRRPSLAGYFAGHTHRNRVRRFSHSGEVPWAEVSAVKDFPGVWAEYRVYEGGILQVVHRISSPEALAWTERTRAMFGGLYPSYSMGTIDDRCFPIWPRA
jgi:3',5'-cyclic AMP phosphodiesterase CpdA